MIYFDSNSLCRLVTKGQLISECLFDVNSRVRPRFFDQVGHESMYASSGNKHFFTKSCHRQTYQNYEQSRQNWAQFKKIKYLKNKNFQKHFILKVGFLVKYCS